jgi:hypothetical protein
MRRHQLLRFIEAGGIMKSLGCQELGPVQLSGSSLLNTSLVGNPKDEMLREMTLAKGGDTLHYTSAFPLGGVAYKCGK